MKQKKYSNEFKARIALEAIKGNKTIAEISKEHFLHPNQITRWKQETEANMAKIFEKDKQASNELKNTQEQLDMALKNLGQATLDVEWLKKKLLPYQ